MKYLSERIPALDEVLGEFSDNRRLRVGVWFAIFLLAVWMSLVLSDLNSAQYKKTRELAFELDSLLEIESAEVWKGRLDQTNGVVEDIKQGFWRADSEGLAMAKLQAEVEKLIGAEFSIKRKVKVGSPQWLDGVDSIAKVRIQISANFTSSQLLKFLGDVTLSQRRLRVERLTIRKSSRHWSTEIQLSALFVLGDTA